MVIQYKNILSLISIFSQIIQILVITVNAGSPPVELDLAGLL